MSRVRTFFRHAFFGWEPSRAEIRLGLRLNAGELYRNSVKHLPKGSNHAD